MEEQNRSPWSKVFGSRIKAVEIVYHSGKENTNADALSHQPYLDAPSQGIAESEVQVAAVRDGQPVSLTGGELLQQELPLLEPEASQLDSYAVEQRKDPSLLALIEYLTKRNLPEDPRESRSVASKAVNFTIIDDVLYQVDPQQPNPRAHLVVAGPVQRCHGSCQAHSVSSVKAQGECRGLPCSPFLYSDLSRFGELTSWSFHGLRKETTMQLCSKTSSPSGLLSFLLQTRKV